MRAGCWRRLAAGRVGDRELGCQGYYVLQGGCWGHFVGTQRALPTLTWESSSDVDECLAARKVPKGGLQVSWLDT